MTKTRNKTRNIILATTLLALGATALSAGAASASGFDAFRARLAGPGRPSCLTKQVRPDGTVVFVDRCIQEGAASGSRAG